MTELEELRKETFNVVDDLNHILTLIDRMQAEADRLKVRYNKLLSQIREKENEDV